MRQKSGARILSILIAVLMTITLVPSLGSMEVSADDDLGKSAYRDVMTIEDPANYDDESFEPYGYGVDVPFFMNKQSELLFYQTSRESSGDIKTFFDRLKEASTEDVLSGSKTDALKAPPSKLKQAYFVQAVSFDPTGTGRDDHIAFIGVYHDGSNARCYVWVYDTKNHSWSSEFNLGKENNSYCNWMESQKITDYEAVNFLSITAGDYDGDGLDTLVAFCSFDGIDGYSLYELEYGSSGLDYYENNPEGWAHRHDKYGDTLARKNTIETRMACELDTGDLNGDGLDDLAALTYIGNYNEKSLALETYRPIVKITYGETGAGELTKYTSTEAEVWSWEQGWWFNSMVSPGMSIGDVDHDGMEEIVAAGISCDQKKKSETTSERIHDDIDADNIFVCIIGINNKNKAEREYTAKIGTNEWTRSGFYDGDKIWNKTGVQCAAINGLGNADQIFISGTLYKMDDNGLKDVHTPEIFRSDNDNLSSKLSSNMYVQSTASGNFDGNDKGYEQIAYTVSCKTKDKRSYDYMRGVVGGKKYNNTTGIAREYYSTAANRMNDDYAWPGRGKDNASGYISEHQGLNCIVVSADNDNDGVLARYKEKAMIYSDPEVLCVLQAPPYFKEVKDYMTDTSSTAYEILESYAFDRTKSDSVSYGVGVVAGMESPAIQMEMTAGYAMDWSQEFTEGHADTVSIGWAATEEDLVLVQRKPAVSYYYEIQSQNGNWDGDCMVVTVPCRPSLVTMGIGKYNAFAQYYNKILTDSEYLKDYHNSDVPEYMKQYHTLDLLDNQWLGHEGDPTKYIKWTNSLFKNDSGYRILQETPASLGHNSESVSWGKTSNNSVGVTENISHGFTYDATIAMGPNVGPASLYVGLTTSLQYMTGESTTKTHTTEQGISCEVNGLKVKDMPASMRGNDYNFSFKMARWPSGMKHYVNGVAEDIPVYGYALSGVTKPSNDSNISIEDQLAAAEVNEKLSELPALENIELKDESAIIEVRKKYDSLSDSAKTLVDVNEIVALENRIKLLKSGGLDITNATVKLSSNSFVYNGKVMKPGIISINGLTLKEGLDYMAEWSDANSKNAGTYYLTISGKGLCTGTVKVQYTIAKAANPLAVTAKTVTVSHKKLKKKSQKIAAAKVFAFTNQINDRKIYTKVKGNKKIVINKNTGKVTVKKGLKKGTYKVKVKIKAEGNINYLPSAEKTVTFKIKVKK